jgi:lipopolysaccharide transport system ATP-binding protein
MAKPVIKVETIGKQYRLGQVGTGTLTADINRWWHRVRGKEDPYLKLGEMNNRGAKGNTDLVWALKDINFEVKKGEVLGIIGKNGAGKSTLLKILSRVTSPTIGNIKVKGRIASLLEVGTGFHPDLTGRENIFLNGAILGMSKQEIRSKFDEIVSFSGVERYIDTPVKRYSSGMYVRLAFAVAAHLDPEILIVDEVLAVGDAEFQKKCLGKMKSVSEGEGRTILFVSHNMKAVKYLCSNSLVLINGMVAHHGDISKAIDLYMQGEDNSSQMQKSIEEQLSMQNKHDVCYINSINVIQKEKSSLTVGNGEPFSIEIKYTVTQKVSQLRIFFDIVDEEYDLVVRSFHDEHKTDILEITEPGTYTSRAKIPANILTAKYYSLGIKTGIYNERIISDIKLNLMVESSNNINICYPGDVIRSKVQPHINWETLSPNGN